MPGGLAEAPINIHQFIFQTLLKALRLYQRGSGGRASAAAWGCRSRGSERLQLSPLSVHYDSAALFANGRFDSKPVIFTGQPTDNWRADLESQLFWRLKTIYVS